ncbi:L-threonine dehydratase catabolic TdcB-like [Watersipora subatra]|uniref:L-threonine dehydratase catabolic TdcB-like n=1 Tax=Watersipora subatra TaxID=2589382 RepID=UPI00355BD418
MLRSKKLYYNVGCLIGHCMSIVCRVSKMNDESIKQELEAADRTIRQSPLCIRTPLLADCWAMFQSCWSEKMKNSAPSKLSLKLEHLQSFGSFKIRGVVNQMQHLPDDARSRKVKLVTMSAGNYGRAFAEACHRNNLDGLVVLPEFAPESRVQFIESKGLATERSSNIICRIKEHQNNGCLFLHSYDDPLLFYGYGSASKEIFEDEPLVDVIVTGCGGGGFLSGVALDAKLRNPGCEIYGVEPCNANAMHRSFELGEAFVLPPNSRSIASGLSAPSAGEHAYRVCREKVKEIILVTEEEIKKAVHALYDHGLLVEPAGSAVFAALMCDKIPDIANKNVVLVLSGRNMTANELFNMHNVPAEVIAEMPSESPAKQ